MDDVARDPGEAFSIPDLWGPSKLFGDSDEHLSFLFSQQILNDVDANLPDIVQQYGGGGIFFNMPDGLFGLPEPAPVTLSNPPHSIQPLRPIPDEREPTEGDIHDIWLFSEDIPLEDANYQNWDDFNEHDRSAKDRNIVYISEAGPHVFDAALAADADYLHVGNNGHGVVDSKVYATSVRALGLGRSSVLFSWFEEKRSFQPIIPKMRIFGYTGETLEKLLVTFMDSGNVTKSLQRFVDETYAENRSPGQIALADTVSTLLATIQLRFNASASTYYTILQLQALFQPVQAILTCFQRIVNSVTTTRSDEAMLSTVFEEVQLLEHRTDSLREILLEILSRVSRPWLEFAGEWLGLQRETGQPLSKNGIGKSFVKVEDREWIDEQGIEFQAADYMLDYDKVPSFISPDDGRAMFEVGKSLRFLRVHHTDHPLAKADVVASANPPLLEWKFAWQDIVRVETKALRYEKDLTAAIHHSSQISSKPKDPVSDTESPDFQLTFFGMPEEVMQAHLLASIDTFDEPLKECIMPDRLSDLLNIYLSANGEPSQHGDSIFSPPISLTPLLSFNPVISAQARLVNGTCVRMIFKAHNLREHLTLQRNFHLLGNGVFSSRLAHALFDPELESAERHRGVARTGGVMGLRLGGRDTWPPASSELRLALMGVLTESYVSNQSLDRSRTGSHLGGPIALPGDLSFAVRDMSQEEIEKCMDADSIEALDFLRLSYKPPPALEAIITPVILFKYDQLFKLLLRAVRMLYVTSTLFRDVTDRTSRWQDTDRVAERFRIESHHFISSLCGYFFDTGIDATWRVFDRKLDQIEEWINNGDEIATLGQNEGLEQLRDYHERVLDRMMFALLLRKRQQPVLKLLEEIFSLVLQFSKHSREMALGIKKSAQEDAEVRDIYLGFKKKVGVFIAVCKGLSEQKGYGDRKATENKVITEGGLFDSGDLAEENTISQLFLRLDMSNYYSKPDV